MKLSEQLKQRGFAHQTTLDSAEALDGPPLAFYWGVDPSADSMTVGHLAVAMMVRQFIQAGHRAFLLVGGATGMIGDPKNDAERDLSSLETIAKNKKAIAAQYRRLFEGMDFTIVDNYDWFKSVKLLPFLRDVGKQFSMSQLLDREFVKSRVGEGKAGLSYAEFSYSLIQGYDFWHLFKRHGVTLQVCGSDQWGNAVSGVELIRKLEGAQAHVWSAPLIINPETGVKFGKSETGAVWLDERKTSAYRFYQFWLNVGDQVAGQYLKIYTALDLSEIDELLESAAANPSQRLAQKRLAREVTELVHGAARAEAAERVSRVLFEAGDPAGLTSGDLKLLSAEIPTVRHSDSLMQAAVDAGLATSLSDAGRLLASGGLRVNGRVPDDGRLPDTRPLIIKKGKNEFALILG